MRALRVFDMKKSYHFLSGVDDATFCGRVSDFLAEGYILYGNVDHFDPNIPNFFH